jgi:hypothetical protein
MKIILHRYLYWTRMGDVDYHEAMQSMELMVRSLRPSFR